MTLNPQTRFVFTPENLKQAKTFLTHYPSGKQASAVIPLLDLAQRQNHGWLSPAAIDYVADFLNLPKIRVYEVVSFYSMFHRSPVGKHQVRICRTLPCQLCGMLDLVQLCEEYLGITCGQTTPDGLFTLSLVECLGACVCAPVVWINDDYYENVTPQSLKNVLQDLANNSDI